VIAPQKKEEEIEMCEGVRMAEQSGREAVNFVQPFLMARILLTPCATRFLHLVCSHRNLGGVKRNFLSWSRSLTKEKEN
jgi:hypothetical protein